MYLRPLDCFNPRFARATGVVISDTEILTFQSRGSRGFYVKSGKEAPEPRPSTRLRPLNFYSRALIIGAGALTAAIYRDASAAIWITSGLLFTIILIVTVFIWRNPNDL